MFAFFSNPQNLEELTPDWLHFEILTPMPVEMAAGTCIDYRLRWYGIRLRWRSEIAAWEPPGRFVDRQIRGPYRVWIHEHSFADLNGGTLVGDTVEYATRGGGGILIDGSWAETSTGFSPTDTIGSVNGSKSRISKARRPA